MTTWIIDVIEKSGRRVDSQDAQYAIDDRRYRKVSASTYLDAFETARREVGTLVKLAAIKSGHEQIMSDRELDWLIDSGIYPMNVVSVPNPLRCGILDAYLVGVKSCPGIAAYVQRSLASSNQLS